MKVSPSIVSVIFHALIEDLSEESLKLSAMFAPGARQRACLKRVVRIPRTSAADLGSVSKFIESRYERSSDCPEMGREPWPLTVPS
jgi:hypothetical protein